MKVHKVPYFMYFILEDHTQRKPKSHSRAIRELREEPVILQ